MLSLRGERNERRSNLLQVRDCRAPLRFARNDILLFLERLIIHSPEGLCYRKTKTQHFSDAAS